MEDTRTARSSKSPKQGSHDLIETVGANTGLIGICKISSTYYYSYKLNIFMGFLNMRMKGPLTLVLSLGTLLIPLGFCAQLLHFITFFLSCLVVISRSLLFSNECQKVIP